MNLSSTQRSNIISIAALHGATNVRLFGSAARGDDRPDSDIDLLVDFEPGFTLVSQAQLAQELETVLHHKVDIVSARALRPRVRERVLKEAVPL